MIVLKKMNLVFATCLFIGANGIAQDGRMDIGTMISTSNKSRIAIEFRKPIGDHYKFKLSATYGSSYDFIGAYENSEITLVSDSLILERISNSSSNQGGIRIGAERRFKTSMFSVGADLNIAYHNRVKSKHNRSTILEQDGKWNTYYYQGKDSSPLNAAEPSLISQHFIVPSLRVSFNMDVPLGKSFLLNLFVASSFGAPIYMGVNRIDDPYNEFIGSPPSTFDFDSQAGIGLRYLIGKAK